MVKKFSLIELLVVVAIIGILASLLLPTLKEARKKSKSAVCKSTIGQLGVSAYMFADDNDGRIPVSGAAGSFPNTPGRWWTHALNGGGYVKWTEEAMSCPSLPYEGDWLNDTNYVTYGAPRLGGRTGEITSPYSGFKLTEVESPSEFFWYSDSAKKSDGVIHQWNNYEYWYKNNNGKSSGLRIHNRHSEKANLWFADGHVSSHWLGSMKQLGIDYIFTENGTALSF
ncbi:prepilin-type N-terminal cleavage/methylation domain-containing protein [Lentisphaera marina]|uniref:prepilin-type N-terminal cleavage/methylation domain-containing protein n=1 Tax=Lentisphaera marina TaxID=1111041 RepID=UPI0023664C54|nr:prepilin-type N-terminal cleavage/methylation domain-containing protein [Lentisphaera marina]MDD7985105.1 prepilin-type N-terminal cleavage/methylation domain-containing protein [Lentisphaera marina]